MDNEQPLSPYGAPHRASAQQRFIPIRTFTGPWAFPVAAPPHPTSPSAHTAAHEVQKARGPRQVAAGCWRGVAARGWQGARHVRRFACPPCRGCCPRIPTRPCASLAGISTACRVPVARRATQHTPHGEGPSRSEDPTERHADEALGAVLPWVACVQEGAGEEGRGEGEAEVATAPHSAMPLCPCGSERDTNPDEDERRNQDGDCCFPHGLPPHTAIIGNDTAQRHAGRDGIIGDCPHCPLAP